MKILFQEAKDVKFYPCASSEFSVLSMNITSSMYACIICKRSPPLVIMTGHYISSQFKMTLLPCEV